MNTQNNKYFINVPYIISSNKNLNDKEKLLLSLVVGFFDGDFIMSNDTIANVIGSTRRTVQRTLLMLRKKGLIRTEVVFENNFVVGRIIHVSHQNTLIKKLKAAA